MSNQLQYADFERRRLAAACAEFERACAAYESRFRAPIVCMVGSTRFKQAWIAENARLTGEGNIVLSVGLWGHHEQQFPDADTKAKLDVLHMRKIDLCDWILVLDVTMALINPLTFERMVGPYIGASTRNEIEYATMLGRPIRYLSKEFPEYVEPVDPLFEARQTIVRLQGEIDTYRKQMGHIGNTVP